jgi:hypothetical protein
VEGDRLVIRPCHPFNLASISLSYDLCGGWAMNAFDMIKLLFKERSKIFQYIDRIESEVKRARIHWTRENGVDGQFEDNNPHKVYNYLSELIGSIRNVVEVEEE